MRVLVLQLKRIGDVILTTPLLSALREHIPGCTIIFALDTSTSSLAPALNVDQVLIFQRGLAGFGFWHQLARGGFDLCFDLTGNDRSAIATALSRAPRRITWSRFRKKPFRRALYTEFIDSSVKGRHTADHHTDLLRALEIHTENVPLQLFLPQAAEDEANRVLADLEITTPFIAVHAGTARPEKYWLPNRWAAVIEILQSEFHLPVVLTGSGDASERAHLDAIQSRLLQPCPNCSGRLSLLGTAALLRRARLLCGVDSAPVHLADAVDTPLVALFGPTNPFHWRPRRSNSRIVTAGKMNRIIPDFPQGPMSDISVETVVNAARDMLR